MGEPLVLEVLVTVGTVFDETGLSVPPPDRGVGEDDG